MGISEQFDSYVLSAHKSISPNSTYLQTFGEIARGVEATEDISYISNNYGHRSDDFTNTHNASHILFAGCSISFGEGLPYMSNWSGKLYNKIQTRTPVSGYFNLSFLGGSSELILSNIYKYILNYGKPDFLFIHLPETSRFISYGKEYNNATLEGSPSTRKRNIWYVYNMMISLELLCKALGTKLLWTTWDKNDNSFYSETKSFNNFISTTSIDIALKATNKYEKNNKYYDIARDKAHPGLMYSDGLANIFYSEAVKRWQL